MLLVKLFGILICLLQSAMFSGLNLGFFGLSRLKLEVQADIGNRDAERILYLRKDAHFLLATLLWGNVASNVLLTLLADSVMAGFIAFIFSTIGITLLGEIFPQAYLSRNALKASVVLVPIIRFYQILLFVIAKPTAALLDAWLGKEKIGYFKEEEIMHMLHRHATSKDSDVDQIETKGAINFLELDDIKLSEEGEIINPLSIIELPVNEKGLPIVPLYERSAQDPFIQRIHASKEKWVIFSNPLNGPMLVLNADQFLRDVMYSKDVKSIYTYCHRPIIVKKMDVTLGEVIDKFRVRPEHSEDDVVDNDIILYWRKKKRIITGADILGRLLRGIVRRDSIYTGDESEEMKEPS